MSIFEDRAAESLFRNSCGWYVSIFGESHIYPRSRSVAVTEKMMSECLRKLPPIKYAASKLGQDTPICSRRNTDRVQPYVHIPVRVTYHDRRASLLNMWFSLSGTKMWYLCARCIYSHSCSFMTNFERFSRRPGLLCSSMFQNHKSSLIAPPANGRF